MTEVRDWTKTLWSASYRGIPFFFESDEEQGGRGLVIHEFPHRDDPFVEDLGEKPRFYSGTAYVHGDDADAQAASLIVALASKGPAILVVPIRGPVLVHPEEFTRTHEKDKLGYVAFKVKFVRAGGASGLISIGFAAQLSFTAADALAVASSTLFARVLHVSRQPEYVVDAAVAGVQTAAATLDVVRTQNPVDPVVSATVRNAVIAIVAAAPLLILKNPAQVDPNDVATLKASAPAIDPVIADPPAVLAAVVTATVRALADGMTPDTAAGAMLAYVLAFADPGPTSYLSPGARSAAENAAAAASLARLSGLAAWAEAIVRRSYTSRPQGVTARAEIAERFEIEMNLAAGDAGYDLYVALQNLRGAVVTYITRLINDLAPVVTVSTNISMPALVLAWRLYADPTREVDLVLRNEVVNPLSMPLEIAALSPRFGRPAALPTTWPAP